MDTIALYVVIKGNLIVCFCYVSAIVHTGFAT